MASQTLHRERIEASIKVLDQILRGKILGRLEAQHVLRETYSESGVEPLGGLSRIKAYDKELATVYIVGRYGLGIIDDGTARKLDDIFHIENVCDAIKALLEGSAEPDVDAVRRLIGEIKGSNTEEKVFRFLRYIFTGVILGFFDEQLLVRSIKSLEGAFPELKEKLHNYVRFYTAYKIAEMIALGQIKTLEDKKIYKYAYCVKLGFQRCNPSDKLIREIAAKVYKVPQSTLNRLFPSKGDIIPSATR